MDINEFRERFLDDIKYSANINEFSTRESFLHEVSSILIDSDLIDDDIEYVYFDGTGYRNKSIAIDGYLFNELDENLCIYITYINDASTDIETITQTVANQQLKKAYSFITDAKYLTDNLEESSPAYGLAYDIIHKYHNIRKYSVFLITDYSMSKTIKNIENDIYNNIPVEFHIIDINRIFEYNMSQNQREELDINLIELSDNNHGIPCLFAGQSDNYTAYLCSIPGIMLAKIYNKFGSRLLEGNVRSFLQTKGKVNKGIRTTILNNPEMFFAYNNGITVTASDITIDNENGNNYIKTIKGMQIVNGGQTTASLGSALLNDKKENSEEQIKKIFVPMKLSIVSKEKSLEIIPEISKYANSQNKVSDADLGANHPFQIRVEEFSRRIPAPAVNGNQFGTYWYYERAKGQYRQETYKYSKSAKKQFDSRNPKEQMFTKTDLSKYINIKLLKPNMASVGNQKSFSTFASWLSEQWDKDQTYFNENFYKELIALAILYRQTDLLIKKQPWYTGSYKANIVIYTLSIIIYNIQENYKNFDINYREIWNNQNLSKEWIIEIEKVSKLVYEFLTDPNRGVENVTEWAKRTACWDNAKSKIIFDFEKNFIDKLISKDEQKVIQKAAKKEQRIENKINSSIAVYNLGSEFWKQVYNWNESNRIFSEKETAILKIATEIDNGKIPSDAQSKILVNMLEKAKDNGFSI